MTFNPGIYSGENYDGRWVVPFDMFDHETPADYEDTLEEIAELNPGKKFEAVKVFNDTFDRWEMHIREVV